MTETIITAIITALCTGGLTWLFTLRYTRKQAEADAMKSVQEVYQELIEDVYKRQVITLMGCSGVAPTVEKGGNFLLKGGKTFTASEGSQLTLRAFNDGSPCYINPIDLNLDYSDDDNPLSLKSDFILSLCELIVGGKDGLAPVEKTIIDRCVRIVYRDYLNDPKPENMPLLEDLYNALRAQDEKEAQTSPPRSKSTSPAR